VPLRLKSPSGLEEAIERSHIDRRALERHHVSLELDSLQASERSPVQKDTTVVIDEHRRVDVLDVVGNRIRLRHDRTSRIRIDPRTKRRIATATPIANLSRVVAAACTTGA
jgi:hypothetical protein